MLHTVIHTAPDSLALAGTLPVILACVALLVFVLLIISSLAPRHVAREDYLRRAMAQHRKLRASKLRARKGVR